ncbi:MAG: Protein-L-isoaspartate O-methyltransferase [uncultured Sphingomonadaceae bacterium]|uniref:Protein-L-isoaspartate O-methyltransferase n=1 Tax=uncultured Sphingomonadaceae bacterium TaxID=169976 RepID=A0A6J4TLA6_9SPHN|nr:MAG: Protein-L-isoaspartate O-methyltransferase [uncultured Sphingomonadaceae bacterium]
MVRIILGALVLAITGDIVPEDTFARAREQMVAEVRNLAATAGMTRERRLDPAVLDALRTVPRHMFVPRALQSRSYENRPLLIGHEQTISQPYIVALMTDLLDVGKDDVVLEVGTGSGYQAAVLATLVRQVYSVEIVAPLAEQASERLRGLGYGNVTVRQGEGYAGWPEHAPFDAIIVTAGAPRIPGPLIEQLKPGGRMVIPVGPALAEQQLMLVEKRLDGRIRKRSLGPVAFVPLTGAGGAR